MQSRERYWRSIAGVNGFLAIAMGAVAAHAIRDAHAAEIAGTASQYQLIHAVALLWLANKQGRGFDMARWLFLMAIILFCGTLYLKALTGWASVAALAPPGGICFMAGWLMIAFANGKDA